MRGNVQASVRRGEDGALEQSRPGLLPYINAVNTNKPKMLTGLDQKVRDGYEGIQFPSSETQTSPANRQGPNPSGHTSGTW